mgnify:CR=1 FL=1
MQNKQIKTIDPDDIRKAIYLIDAYRTHFYDISWIDKKVDEGTLGNHFRPLWKNLRKRMVKMASVSSHIIGVKKLAKIQSYFEALWQIFVPLVIITFFVNIFAPETFSFIKGIALYITVLAFSSMLIGLIGRFMIGGKIGKKIDEHFQQNPEAQKIASQEIKAAVQLLIDELRRYLRETGEKPKKHLIGISFLDYNGIKMVKKPKPWRKYYLAQLNL